MNADPAYIAQQALNLRRDVGEMLGMAGSGHTGGSLSIVDLLAVLYYAEFKHDPAQPDWPERDRFVLSKGHAAPALYSVLARTGYFPVEKLVTLDGHDYGRILSGFKAARAEIEKPTVLIAKTIKGKGVSFTENQVCWHGIAPDHEQVCLALDELK